MRGGKGILCSEEKTFTLSTVDNMRVCMQEEKSYGIINHPERDDIEFEKIGTMKTTGYAPMVAHVSKIRDIIDKKANVTQKVYSVDPIASNSMKSNNPHSGFHKSKVIKTLDTSVPDPSKNQGGHIIMEENRRVADLCNSGQESLVPWEQQGHRIQGVSGVSPTLTCNPAGGMKLDPVLHHSIVRRLTPLECERLQGFPSVIKRSVFSICLDIQKNCANVEIKSHRLQSNVFNAEESVRQEFVQYAENNLQNDLERKKQLVVVRVQINCGQMVVGELNREKFTSLANGVEQKNLFLQSIRQEDFAQAVVRISQIVEKQTITGKVELHQQVMLSTHRQNGNWLAEMCGQESEAIANDVGNMQTTDITSIISSKNQNTQNSDSTDQTLSSYVLNVINSFIQKRILLKSSFEIWFEVEDGYTNIPWANKQTAPDSRRYKALGNSMAVPVMHWIGKQMMEATEIVCDEAAIDRILYVTPTDDGQLSLF